MSNKNDRMIPASAIGWLLDELMNQKLLVPDPKLLTIWNEARMRHRHEFVTMHLEVVRRTLPQEALESFDYNYLPFFFKVDSIYEEITSIEEN